MQYKHLLLICLMFCTVTASENVVVLQEGCADSSSMSDVKQTDQQRFLNSFINYYDFSTVGRYTHEYHPFLFEKSSYSLDGLEKSLVKSGLDISGRLVLTGYEEQAVPSYCTYYRACTGFKINDEAWAKGKSGWVSQSHNKFGVMTGYLFRNMHVANTLHALDNKSALFKHVNLHMMPIYESRATIFQRHAFGRMLPVMKNRKELVEACMLQRDVKGVFRELISFWEKLYESELRFGNRQVLGTQDILFSIAHARHIYRSDVPLRKYYIGPDITYPIKITHLQKKEATYNSQTFVRQFVENLKPVDNKPTAYIFCSFVDGVGKSTLLGNVQNFKTHGDNIKAYKHVDNSSSQLAQLYEYDANVFIADLPAQMSHFTYKPDGFVYFDVMASGASLQEIARIQSYVHTHKDTLIQDYLRAVKDEHVTDGFIKNVQLLKREKHNTWIPFKHQGGDYLFDTSNIARIRKLVPLESADSKGLKNYEPEQMIFSHGVRFPLHYNVFVSDLIGQLKKRGVEKVVFVNFLSMYPRSSRENIRVNYVLQQLALLHKDFSVKNSLYDSFTNDAHLLYRLIKKRHQESLLTSFRQESLVRLALYNVMMKEDVRTVDGIGIDTITSMLRREIGSFDDALHTAVNTMSRKKMRMETDALRHVHGMTKDFINVQMLHFEDVLAFGKKLKKYIERHVDDHDLRTLYEDPGTIVHAYEEGEGNKTIQLSNGSLAKLLFVFNPNCKSGNTLAPIIRTIRASWYCVLLNLMDEEQEKYRVPMVWVKKLKNGNIAVIRKIFELAEREDTENFESKLVSLLNITKKLGLQWGVHKENKYLLSLERAHTDTKLFAFGADLLRQDSSVWPRFGLDVAYHLKKYKDKHGPERVMPVEKLYKKLEDDQWWSNAIESVVEFAKEKEKKKKKRVKQEKKEADPWDAKGNITLGDSGNKKRCRFVVKALATLEMILKDPNADLVVRRKHKKDFAAALKVIERVTLPAHGHVIFEGDLFDDYHNVKPIVKFKKK